MVALRVLSHELGRVPDGARVLAAAIGADPGVQHGLAAAVLVDAPPTRGCPRVIPLHVALLGQRAVRSPKALARPARAPEAHEVRHAVAILRNLLAQWAPDVAPALVAEDWFIGPNGSTVRDTARQFYYAQAAAEDLGLRFRPVQHGIWKKAELGSARLPSDEAARAYGRRAADLAGAAAPLERWCPDGKVPTEADDAAALCVAHWYLTTETT